MKALFKASLGLILVSALVLTGCGSADKPTQGGNGKPRVVTSFYPMYEFARNVAGDRAEVVNLVPAGVEPHDWEPTGKDMKLIKEASVFVYNGSGMESWVDKALKSVKKDKVAIVETSKGVELMAAVEADEHAHAADQKKGAEPAKSTDPHIWLDPVLAQKQVQTIQAALEQADPANKDQYKKNADAYILKLQELDKAFKDGLANVKRKEFVTQHAAFAYMAKRYGLTQVPIAGLSPDQEPSPKEMTDIVKFAKERQVRTIFFETLVSPKVAQTVAKELGAKTSVLNPIEGLTDEDKSKNLDYIGLMKLNMEALKTGLSE